MIKYILGSFFLYITFLLGSFSFSYTEQQELLIQEIVERHDVLSQESQIILREQLTKMAAEYKDNEDAYELIRYVLGRLYVQTPQGKKSVSTQFVKYFPPLTNKVIEPTGLPFALPREGNSSNIFVVEIKGATKTQGSIRFDGNSEFVYNKFIGDTYDIELALGLRTDIGYVEVYHVNSDTLASYPIEEGHILKYTIGKDIGNVDSGVNTYIVRGYTPDTIFHHVVDINIVDVTESMFGEEVVAISDEQSDRQLALNACNDNESEDRKDCYDQVNDEYTITTKEACDFEEGVHLYNLDVYRPEKKASARSFLKVGNELFYTVQVSGTENGKYPSCENEDIEQYVYSYDCSTYKPSQVMNDDPDMHNLGKCGLHIHARFNNILLVKHGMRECYDCTGFEGYGFVNISTGEEEKLDIMSFDGIEKLIDIDAALMKRYVGEEGNAGFLTRGYSIGDVDAAGRGIITKRVQYDNESGKSIEYTVGVDLVAKKLLF